MMFDVTFDEQNTDFNVGFKESGVYIRDTVVDDEISLESTNPVQNKVITQYVDNAVNDIWEAIDEIENGDGNDAGEDATFPDEYIRQVANKEITERIDKTLTEENMAADAKATGDAIKNRTTTKHIVLELDTLKSQNVMNYFIKSTSVNSIHTTTMSIVFVPAISTDGVMHTVVDTPVEVMYVNGDYIWLNKPNFKRVGLISPAMEQYLGVSRILWFDTLGEMFKTLGFSSYETNMELKYTAEFISELALKTSSSSLASQAKSLLENALASPGNKLVFEYQEQENIEQIEAQYIPNNITTISLSENIES